MQRETEFGQHKMKIDDDYLVIRGINPIFSRTEAPALIAFIQQWLGHDPERELKTVLQNIRHDYCYTDMTWDQMLEKTISAVREHDAKYRRET